MASPAMLTCWTVSGDEKPTDLKDLENAEAQVLHQEKGKKSSFLLNLDDSHLERPDQTQLVVENNPELQNNFFLGGFQIVSNAKQSKVYLTGRDGKEAYLTTSKGIPFDKESGKQWYKSVCVVPGGPRLISRLRLEILNVQPHEEGEDDSTRMTKIRYLKLTARIPDKALGSPGGTPSSSKRKQLGAAPMSKLQQGTGSAFAPAPPSLSAMFGGQNGSAFVPTAAGINVPPSSNLGAMPPPPSMTQAFPGGPAAFAAMQQAPSAPPPLTQDDLGAAMAGISMMARSTQENMEKSFETKTKELQTHMDAQWGKVEGYIRVLTQVVVSQKTVLDEKNKIMQQQHEMVAEQSRQIATLLQHQTELQSTVQSLQSGMKELQQQVGQSLESAGATTPMEAQTRAVPAIKASTQDPPSQDVLEAVAKTALAEQQSAITPAIESIQTNMESLGEYIKGNKIQEDGLKNALENIQTDVKSLKEMKDFAKDMSSLQEEKLSSTLESLQSEMVQLRQSMDEDSGKRDEMSLAIGNIQSSLDKLEQMEPKVVTATTESSVTLSASVDALEKDVTILRDSMKKTAEAGTSQQKALEKNLDALKMNLSEMQKNMQENAESMKLTAASVDAAAEESPTKVKEIHLTGIRDFENDIFSIRSLEHADTSNDDDEKKFDPQHLQQQEKEAKAAITEAQEVLRETPQLPRPLTPDRPFRNENLAIKEKLVLKQSVEALKEFRQVNQQKDQLRSNSSGDSTATHGSVNSTATPPSTTSISTPPTPPITNVSMGKPPLNPNSTPPSDAVLQAAASSFSMPPPSLNRLVNSGSLVDNEDDELIEGEIVETDISFGDNGEFIVSVETQDASSEIVTANAAAENQVEVEKVVAQKEEPTESTKNSDKRNMGSLVMEPNGSLVVDVDEDGDSLVDVDLGAKATAMNAGEEGAAVKENTSDNVQQQQQGGTAPNKDGKRVSFRDTSLEDRYEYSPEIQMSGSSAGDSVGTSESSTGDQGEPESEGILEMGMKLFNNAGWL